MGVARSSGFATQLHCDPHSAIEFASLAVANGDFARSVANLLQRYDRNSIKWALSHLMQEQDRGYESSDLHVP